MSFDIDQLLKDMTNAVADVVKDDSSSIKDYSRELFDNEKQSLKELAEARIRKDIDEEIFNRELAREKKVLEIELLTISIMNKAMAQKATNAALDIFVKAVKTAI